MLQAGYIYNTLISKKKERFDIILEPLQAFVQLALLSFTPSNSKINIHNNILYIQIPGWKQSVMRTYYSDSKSDLFFLFNVIQRFNKFYSHLENISNNNTNLLNLLNKLSIKGIDNLLQTYRQTDNPALLHTLNIYKNMIHEFVGSEPRNFNVDGSLNSSPASARSYSPANSLSLLHEQSPNQSPNQSHNQSPNQSPKHSPNQSSNQSRQPSLKFEHDLSNPQYNLTDTIDNVFVKITSLYNEHEYIIIFNMLLLIQTNPNNYLEYIEGLNKILEPINKRIQKWIVDNIVY